MTDAAPKRIWADPPETFDGMDVWRSEPGGRGVEYILASEHVALIREAEARVWDHAAQIGGDAAVEVLLRHEPDAGPLKIQMTRQAIANPIRRAAKGDPT